MLKEAKANPISIPVDARKLERKPLFKTKSKVGDKKIETLVSVPDAEEVAEDTKCVTASEVDQVSTGTDHTQTARRYGISGQRGSLVGEQVNHSS